MNGSDCARRFSSGAGVFRPLALVEHDDELAAEFVEIDLKKKRGNLEPHLDVIGVFGREISDPTPRRRPCRGCQGVPLLRRGLRRH